jgi:hypothetical protein
VISTTSLSIFETTYHIHFLDTRMRKALLKEPCSTSKIEPKNVLMISSHAEEEM